MPTMSFPIAIQYTGVYNANANKLFQKLKIKRKETYFIENLEGLKMLNLPLAEYRSALVVSSSSTPPFIERETVDYLLAI